MSYPYKSRILEKLGVRSWINAKNWSTNIGGNFLRPPEVEIIVERIKRVFGNHRRT